MAVSKEKWDLLFRVMETLGIREEDLFEKFILGSGKGGQKINKTSSCVYLKHLPTGIEIKCQKSRFRELNRYYARQEICERIKEKFSLEKSRKQQEAEKIRRQKRKRSRRAQLKVLLDKKRLSKKKELRKEPRGD